MYKKRHYDLASKSMRGQCTSTLTVDKYKCLASDEEIQSHTVCKEEMDEKKIYGIDIAICLNY